MNDPDICMDCGGHNPVWFAPNDLWNLVIGGPDAKGDPGGFYCPNCFIVRAETAGVVPTAWKLELEPPTPKEKDTPHG